MSRARKLDHARVRELLQSGMSMQAVADQLGTTWSVIRYVHRAGFKRSSDKRAKHRRVPDGRRGNGFGQRKISETVREEIYRAYWESGRAKTHKELALEYGVSQTTIIRIVNKRKHD
jgi:transposase-like protein